MGNPSLQSFQPQMDVAPLQHLALRLSLFKQTRRKGREGHPARGIELIGKQVMSLLLTFHWPGLHGSSSGSGSGTCRPQLAATAPWHLYKVEESSADFWWTPRGVCQQTHDARWFIRVKICWFEFLYLDPIRCHGELCIWEKFFLIKKDVHVSLLPMPLNETFTDDHHRGRNFSL